MKQAQHKAVVLAVASLFGSALVSAAELPPNAGLIGNTLQQPEALPRVTTPALQIEQGQLIAPKTTSKGAAAQQVTLSQVRFSGIESMPQVAHAQLDSIASAYLNKPVSFDDLQALVTQVTAYCRAQGYVLAQAYLAPGALNGGVLTVPVQAGRYDQSQIQATGDVDRAVVERLIKGATPVGGVVEQAQLERLSLLLNEVPGMTGAVTLKPGTQAGTSALDIAAQEGKRLGAYVGMDNEGLANTGRIRAMAGAYANNLLGDGDQLRVDLIDSVDGNGAFTGSLDYSLLAGNYGTRAGVNASHLNYQYLYSGASFMGYSDNASVYVNHPWVRTANARIDARLEGGMQKLTDFYPDIASFDPGVGRKDIPFATGTVLGSLAWVPGGVTGFKAQVTSGELQYRNDTARFIGSADALNTTGGFTRWAYQLNHDQQFAEHWSIYGNVYGQYSDRNLDSSQKMLLGGPMGVRAYDTGTGSVTNGAVATVEVRSQWSLPQTSWLGANHQLTLAGFYDQGWGQQYAQNTTPHGLALTSANNVNLAGAGVYAKVGRVNDYSLTLTWAKRTGVPDPVSGSNATNQFWVTGTKLF